MPDFSGMHLFVGIMTSAITAIVLLINFGLQLAKLKEDMQKEYNDKIALSQNDFNNKIARAYERLDSVKSSFDAKIEKEVVAHREDLDKLREERANNYVEIKLCKLVHANSEAVMTDIKSQITGIFEQLKELNSKIK